MFFDCQIKNSWKPRWLCMRNLLKRYLLEKSCMMYKFFQNETGTFSTSCLTIGLKRRKSRKFVICICYGKRGPVAWCSLNGRSVSLEIPSDSSSWLLTVPNFVSTYCLSVYLEADRCVSIAFKVWVIKKQIVAPVSNKNSIQFSVLDFSMGYLTDYTN